MKSCLVVDDSSVVRKVARRILEDLDYIVRFVEAALLTGDDTVVVEFVGWLVPLLSARGVPPGVVQLGVTCLRRCLPREHEGARRLLDLAADLVGR